MNQFRAPEKVLLVSLPPYKFARSTCFYKLYETATYGFGVSFHGLMAITKFLQNRSTGSEAERGGKSRNTHPVSTVYFTDQIYTAYSTVSEGAAQLNDIGSRYNKMCR